jgi:peroxiredoxin
MSGTGRTSHGDDARSTGTLAEGEQAPPFRATSSKGQTLDDGRFIGKVPVVLVFAPAPTAVGVNELLCRLDDQLVEFGHRRVQLLVVLPSTSHEVREVAERGGHKVTLLADPSREMERRFEAVMDERSTGFVALDRDGVVRWSDALPTESVDAPTLLRRLDDLQDAHASMRVVEGGMDRSVALDEADDADDADAEADDDGTGER